MPSRLLRIVLPVVAVALLACSGLRLPSQTVTASDSSASVDVPLSMIETELNDEASIERVDPLSGLCLIVISESGVDITSDLRAYADRTVEKFVQDLTDVVKGGPTQRTVDGRPALAYSVSGAGDRTPFEGLHVTVEGEDAWFQIIMWSDRSRWSSNQRRVAELLDSFHELGPVQTPNLGGERLTEFSSADGRFAIDAPESWMPTELNDMAHIELQHPSGDAFLIVISEPRATVDWDLETYATHTRDTLMGSWEGATAEAPVRVERDGRDVVHALVRGNYEGLSLAGLHAVVEDGPWYHQVLVWAPGSRWSEVASMVVDSVQTVRAVPTTDRP